ncbi:MAG TPA: uL15m family ribosomal protein, partial [Bacilli bacterium]|nr:uL15m family ribosomal protein [Bacilli bacterium]
LEKKVNVKANRFSSKAVSKIEELGGTTEVI